MKRDVGTSVVFVGETELTDERAREAFRDIKNTLHTRTVALLFQAWAPYPRFLDAAWRRLRPSALTQEFAELASRLETDVRAQMEGWSIGDHASSLRARGVSDAEISHMREIIALFTEVDPKLAILAAAVDAGLSGMPVGGVGTKGPHRERDRERPTVFRSGRFSQVEERDAPPRVRALYDDMKATLGLPFVETEYRAMACYPDWLEIFWRDCKSSAAGNRYRTLCERLAGEALGAAKVLPHRFHLSESVLASCEIDAAQRNELRRISATFTRLFPGLLINLEIARRGLG